MIISIKPLINGAKQAKGLVVIIDVFRAFSTECYAFDNGAKEIIAVKTVEEFLSLKEEYKSAILIGERHGIKLDGADFGNSPSEIEKVDFTNKTIIHTTSSGIQGIENATKAQKIITGSLVNAKAIVKYIQNNSYDEVTLCPMGLEGISETEEDNLCALYIQSLLNGIELDIDTQIEHLKQTDGAKFFDPKQQNVFPMKDFYLSTKLNIFDFVLEVNTINNHHIITKVSI